MSQPTEQLSLFQHIEAAYIEAARQQRPLDNPTLYDALVQRGAISRQELAQHHSVGAQPRVNTAKRKIRWHQQTLKAAGVLRRIPGLRGHWAYTSRASGQDNEQSARLDTVQPQYKLLAFSTDLGVAILSSCKTLFSRWNEPIHLILTSPPYPLRRPRQYGNPSEREFVDWLCDTLEPSIRCLAPGGSLCLNVSNDIFMPGSPARSTYCERLVLALEDRFGLHLMDRLVWDAPTKPPGPTQWASRKRMQLNAGYEPIYWFTNDPHRVFSNNQRVLQPHTPRHERLIRKGGETVSRTNSDGAYRIYAGKSFANETAGRIPRNVLRYGGTDANARACMQYARDNGLQPHGATMPLHMARFLVRFLSDPEQGHLVADPMSGYFTVPLAAELEGMRWVGTDIIPDYIRASASRFVDAPGFQAQPWIGLQEKEKTTTKTRERAPERTKKGPEN